MRNRLFVESWLCIKLNLRRHSAQKLLHLLASVRSEGRMPAEVLERRRHIVHRPSIIVLVRDGIQDPQKAHRQVPGGARFSLQSEVLPAWMRPAPVERAALMQPVPRTRNGETRSDDKITGSLIVQVLDRSANLNTKGIDNSSLPKIQPHAIGPRTEVAGSRRANYWCSDMGVIRSRPSTDPQACAIWRRPERLGVSRPLQQHLASCTITQFWHLIPPATGRASTISRRTTGPYGGQSLWIARYSIERASRTCLRRILGYRAYRIASPG
jgi:hypothetical protein